MGVFAENKVIWSRHLPAMRYHLCFSPSLYLQYPLEYAGFGNPMPRRDIPLRLRQVD